MYQAENFLEKNRNFLPSEVIQLVRQSQYDMVRFLFQCPITKTGNLYSAIQDIPGTKLTSNGSRNNTKVCVKNSKIMKKKIKCAQYGITK